MTNHAARTHSLAASGPVCFKTIFSSGRDSSAVRRVVRLKLRKWRNVLSHSAISSHFCSAKELCLD